MKNKKIILLIGTAIIILILLAIFQPQKRSITSTTPLISDTTSSFPEITPTSIFKQPSLTIDWSDAKISNPEKQYPTYSYKVLLSSELADQFAKTLNFQSVDKKVLSQNNLVWKTPDGQQILLYVPKEGNISYQNLQVPQSNNVFQDASVSEKVLSFTKSLLPDLTFKVASINYYKDNYYSGETTPNTAEIAQVYLDQVINNYPVIPSNLGYPHTIIYYLYKDLSIKTFSISNGFSQTSVNQTAQEFDIEKLKNITPESFISLTPLPLDKQSLVNSGTKAVFKVKTIEPAYIGIKITLSPVYLLSGQLKIDDNQFFNETVHYIAPIKN